MRHRFYGTAVLLTLLFLTTRLIQIHAFPIFIDEAYHIHMAERIVGQLSPLDMLADGRQFTAYWLGLFQVWQGDPVWIARAATLLTSVAGFWAFLSIARQAVGLHGVVIVGLLLIFSPYHYFFERMALADTVAASLTVCAAAVAFRAQKRLHAWDAILTGLLVFGAAGAKVNNLVFLPIPLAALVSLRAPNRSWRQRIRWGLLALLVGGGLLGAFMLVARLRGLAFYEGMINRGVGTGNSSVLTLIAANSLNFGTLMSGYFGSVGMLLLTIGCAAALIRRQWYLLICLFAPLLAILASPLQQSRYWIATVTLLIGIAGLELAWITRHSHRARLLAAISVTGLAGVLWLRIAVPAWTDPVHIPLPNPEQQQYIFSEGSGTGFDELLNALDQQAGLTRVLGAIANCAGLQDIAMIRDFTLLECPTFRTSGQDNPELETLFARSRQAGVIVIIEDIPNAPRNIPGRIIARLDPYPPRPAFILYDLSP